VLQPVVERLSELFVAANNDPKVKEVLATFVLQPTPGFKESNALYQREWRSAWSRSSAKAAQRVGWDADPPYETALGVRS
jgi:hypothetical protein